MFERFSNRARSVLVFAQDEARGLQHNFIGTEHLMLGVVQCGDAVVTHFLSGYDFTLEDLRERVRELIGPGEEEVGGPPPFTPRAKKVLELSLREALAMGHDHIAPGHILLGILREAEGVGAKILADAGVDYDRARLWMAQGVGESGPIQVRGRRGKRARFRESEVYRPGMTTAMSVANFAASRAAGAGLVATHHMLLALLNEERSMAAQALDGLGVTKEQVEAKVDEIGIENTSDAPPAKPAKPRTVKLAEGVEVRITDPQLSALVEGGQLEELLKEILRRSKPDA